MTDFNTLTKPALNDLLATPLTASALKKVAKADLVTMAERNIDDNDGATLLEQDFAAARDDTPTAPKAPRKARTLDDRVILAPGKADDVKATKAGSKRHLLAQALSRGTTIEHLMELLSWNRDTVSSALRTDMGAIGLGVERRAGKYHLLLPKGMSRIPARDATTTRADALVAACK